MCKKNKYIFLILIISLPIYCALTIGQSWDEAEVLGRGAITLDYLFSFGKLDKDILYRELYSTIYWSLNYFITEMFPLKYQFEISHLVNLTFSLGTIFGTGKVSKELFNKKVGRIVFLILFFYPVFFGHMSINSKDTIHAFSHIWIVYLTLRYLKNQNINEKANKYIIFIGILAALSTGIQLVFLGSLIPIILFILFEIFLLKKIIHQSFLKKKFLYDIVKCFIVFYFLLILFWIDVHPNILILPFNIIMEMFSANFWTGWPYNLINGNYYLSNEVPKSYLLINLVYKSPEYVLVLYLLFAFLIFKSKNFYKSKFKFFNYKLSFIIIVLIFSNLILLLIPFPLYDGMRLFLWVLPYFCIIPGLTIYYLMENITLVKSRLTLLFLAIFIIYFLFNFLLLTPYQYTYLNSLNGKMENKYNKFENDYWSTSLKELIKKVNFNTNEVITISTCGASLGLAKKYFKDGGFYKIKFISSDHADYIIMTNRVTYHDGLTNCFEKFKGNDVYKVERNGLILSVIRKIKI